MAWSPKARDTLGPLGGMEDGFENLNEVSIGLDRVSLQFKHLLAKLVQVYEHDMKKAREGDHLMYNSPDGIPRKLVGEEFDLAGSTSMKPSLVKRFSSTLDMKNHEKVSKTEDNHKFELRKEFTGEKARPRLAVFTPHMDSALADLVGKCEATAHHPVHSESSSCRFLIHPASKFCVAWHFLTGACLFLDWLMIPFLLCFDPPFGSQMVVLSVSLAIFWTCDLFASFVTGYKCGKHKLIVMEPKRIICNYLKTYFVLDITLVSVDWVLILGSVSKDGFIARLARSARSLKLLKSLRLLRSMTLKKYIRAVEDALQSEFATVAFGIFQSVTFILLLNHFIACIWFFVGSKSANGWVDEDMKRRSLHYQYVSSLHWSLAQFTPAPNEIFPGNFPERLFATLVLVTAMITFSSFTASITAGVLHIRRINQQEQALFWQVKRYLREWGIPVEFRWRVLTYLEYAFKKQRKKIQEKDVTLLSLLSEQLQKELRRITMKDDLFCHPLFNRLRPSVLVFIKVLVINSYGIGDTPLRVGEEGSDMFFLTTGRMRYLKPVQGKHDPIKYNIAPGVWFCEPVLWTPHWMHFGTMAAEKGCQAVTINGKDFGKLVQRNADLWFRVQGYCALFMEALNCLDKALLSDLKDMMDHFDYNLVLDRFFASGSHDSLETEAGPRRNSFLRICHGIVKRFSFKESVNSMEGETLEAETTAMSNSGKRTSNFSPALVEL